MTKKFLTFGILLIVLTGILVPTHTASADLFEDMVALNETAFKAAVAFNTGGGLMASKILDTVAGSFIAPLFKGIGQFLMVIASLFLVVSGKLFDLIIEFTVINMGKNIGDPKGVGGGITVAWATLRDIANMCFIFVLLFAAFKAMFDTNFGNFGTTVRNIIIVALLINFSLFFSKVVIDASNIVSVGFYKSIVTANEASLTTESGLFGLNKAAFKGISGGYMKMLGMQTFYSANILDTVSDQPIKILTLGVVSSMFMLITAVILLISAIMFATRFIILIFLMILSPLALIAYIIPGQQKQFNNWKDSLISQSFFAPLFFALTWVVFKIGSSLVGALPGNPVWTDLITKADAGSINLLLFYIIITGFSIAALVISKQMAMSGATGGAFKAISGGIGTAAIGGAAWVGRKSIGGYSNKVLNDKDLRNRAAAGNVWARMQLATASRMSKSSFDARGLADTKVGKAVGANKMIDSDIIGKAGGKGGYTKIAEDKAKEKAKYAKDVYGQTAEEKEEAAKKKKDYEGYVDKNGNPVKGSKMLDEEAAKKFKDKKEEEENAVKKEETEARKAEEEAENDLETKKKEAEQADKDRIAGKAGVTTETVFEAHKEAKEAEERLRTLQNKHEEALARRKLVIEDGQYSDEVKNLEKLAKDAKEKAEADKKMLDNLNNTGKERMRAYAERVEKRSALSTTTGATIGGAVGSFIPIPVVGTIVGAAVGGYIGRKVGKQENKESAREIRKAAGEKSNQEKAADLLAAIKEEQDKASGITPDQSGTSKP